MKDWFEGLSQRERLALALGALALAVMLFVILVWQPIVSKHGELADTLDRRTADLAWMTTAAAQIKALEGSASEAPVTDERTLIARVTTELKEAGLQADQIRPEGENRLRLTLEGVSFTAMLAPLERLRNRYGVRVREAAVESTDRTGVVDARLLLERG